MKQVKKGIPRNLQRGIPLKVRPGHTVRLEVTDEPLTVHTGLSLFCAISETLEIPRILDVLRITSLIAHDLSDNCYAIF